MLNDLLASFICSFTGLCKLFFAVQMYMNYSVEVVAFLSLNFSVSFRETTVIASYKSTGTMHLGLVKNR